MLYSRSWEANQRMPLGMWGDNNVLLYPVKEMGVV